VFESILRQNLFTKDKKLSILKTVTTIILGLFLCFNLFAQDTQKPVVNSFAFSPTSVDVTSGSANLTFSANITDNLSGVFLVIVTIRLPNNSPLSGNATLTSGGPLNGTWQVNFVIPQNSPAGTGMLFQMSVFDNALNSISFPSPEFPAGTPTFTVVNSNPPDNVAPSLVSFVISPSSVDVSLSSKIVKITANLTDNMGGSGVKTVSANVELPNGTVLSSFGTLLLPSAATALNGNWEIEFTIPKFTTPGTAYITSLNAVDTSGNSITYSDMSIPTIGSINATDFTIDNSNVDNIAPALTSYTVSPPSVNVTMAAQNVTVRTTATDNLAGVKSISVTIQLPNGNFQNANAVYDVMSMSTLNGQWDAVFTIPHQTLSGLGKIILIALLDSANVNRAYSLQAMTLQGPDFIIEGALPVEWLKPVTASIQNRHTMVEWSAGSQINNEKFVIEHSINGKEFYEVGEQKGEENTFESKIYSFIHEYPLKGMNYYRIKQMDYDGKCSYSNIASVSYNSRDLNIYPNPVRNELTITSINEDVVHIYDVYGRLFKSKTIQAGQNKISMSELPSGTYIVALQNGDRYKVIKE